MTAIPKRNAGDTHDEAPHEDLVGLLDTCHGKIRSFAALAREAAVRKDAPDEHIVKACIDVDRYFRVALPLHVADEEQSIRPRLRALSPELDSALDVMVDQHEQHSPKLERLLRALAEVRDDPKRQSARDELATTAAELMDEFEVHLTLEERVIFPAIRELMPRDIQAEVISELRERRRDASPRPPSNAVQEKRS